MPDFPGQSGFLTMCPGKNHSSAGMPICPVFGMVYWICPNTDKLCYFAIRILIPTCFLAIFFAYNIRKIAGSRGSAPNPAGGAHDTPQTPSWTPTARECHARTLRLAPLAIVPDCSAQIMVTITNHQ